MKDNKRCFECFSNSQTDHINRNSAAVSCPELCDQLYDQVAVLEPELAPHLTGNNRTIHSLFSVNDRKSMTQQDYELLKYKYFN